MDGSRTVAERIAVDAAYGPLGGDSWWLRAPDGHLFHVNGATIDVLQAVDGGVPPHDATVLGVEPDDLRALLDLLARHGAVRPGAARMLRSDMDRGTDRLVWWLVLLGALGTALQVAFLLLGEPTLVIADWRHAVIALLLAAAAVPLHEAAHWLAARGCGPARMGLTRTLIFPTVYVDTHHAWSTSRSRRCAVDLAGVAVDLSVAGTAAAVALAAPAAGAVVSAFLLTQWLRLTLTLNPLMQSDGYWLLSDLTGVANLSQRARESLRARRLHWLTGYAALSYGFAGLSVALLALFVAGTAARLAAAL